MSGARALLHRANRSARTIPATLTYAVVVVGTSWWLLQMTPTVRTMALRAASTNVDNLHAAHWWVLLTSAGVVAAPAVPRLLVAGLLLAGVETGLGTGRALSAFAAGHVGASLIVTGLLGRDLLPGVDRSAHHAAIDVGLSYGALAALGAWTAAWPRRVPAACCAAVLVIATWPLLQSRPTFTAWGHATAATIGIALGLCFRRNVRVSQ